MLIPPVLSSRLPTGTFLPCAHERRGRVSAGNPAAPPATAAVRRKSRRLSCLVIAFPPLVACENVSGAGGQARGPTTVPPPWRAAATSPWAASGRSISPVIAGVKRKIAFLLGTPPPERRPSAGPSRRERSLSRARLMGYTRRGHGGPPARAPAGGLAEDGLTRKSKEDRPMAGTDFTDPVAAFLEVYGRRRDELLGPDTP